MRLGSVIFFIGIKHGPLHAIRYKGIERERERERERTILKGAGVGGRQLEAARRIPRRKIELNLYLAYTHFQEHIYVCT